MPILRWFLVLSLFVSVVYTHAQRGLIINTANNASVLDPNGDNYVSLDNSGFSNDGYYVDEFEIRMFPIPVFGNGDTANDTQAGPNCGTTDLTVDSTGVSAYAALDGNNNLIIRMRLADEHPSVEAYTVLIDTDGEIGSGDPNYNGTNAGFEIDITLIKSNSQGINVYDIDGLDSCPSPVLEYDIDDNFQVSIADEVSCGDEDYFYDFFIPFGDLTTEFGITVDSELQFIVVTNISGTCAMAGKISDIGGVDDSEYDGCLSCAFEDLASNQCPVPFSSLGAGGDGFASGSTPEPDLEVPLKEGDAVITGIADPASDIFIDVYTTGGSLIESLSTSADPDSLWSLNLSAPLNQGDSVVAIAEIPGNCDSQASGSQVSFAVVVLNTTPFINGSGTDLVYDENDGEIQVDPVVTAGDNEDLDFVYATIQITGNYNASEDALTFTDQLGIVGSYDAGLGRWTLTGDASIEDYNTALQSVSYINSSEDPDESTRTVEFIVNDGTEDSAPFSRDIVVSKINDPPVLSGTPGSTDYTAETPPFVINSTFSITDADDTDLTSATIVIVESATNNFIDGDELLFVNTAEITGSYNTSTGILSLSGPTSLANYAAAINSIEYEYTPPGTANENTRRIAFNVSDGTDNSNFINHFITFDPATNFPPEVLEVNGEPVVGAIDIFTNEDSSIELCLTVTDPDGDLVEIGSYTDNSSLTGGTLNQTGDLCLTYTPDLNFNGTEPIEIEVCDALGACTITNVTINIEVLPVNDVPTLAPSADQVDEKITTQVCIDPANITDVEGDTHEFSSGTSPNGGTLVDGISGDLCFDYTPPFGFIGVDQVEVTICDSADPSVCATSTIDIDVISVNESPLIYVNGLASSTMSVSSYEDSVKVFCFSVIDVDGDDVSTISVSKLSGNGTLIEDATEFCYEYTPVDDESETSSVWEITIQDDAVLPLTNKVVVTIDILPVNDFPTLDAISGPISILEDDSEQTINLSGIAAGGGESQTLTITATSDNPSLIPDPKVNYASANTAGSLSYIPTSNQYGTATITVTVDDGQAENNTITQVFNVLVSPVNDAPTALTDTLYVLRKEPGTINVLVNDTDIENDPLSMELVLQENPTGGTVDISASGEITYTSDVTFRGEDQLVYTVIDGGSPPQSTTGTVIILVDDNPFTVYQTISPNGDGRNDYWHIEGIDYYPNNTVRLYDRYNNLVFEMDGYNNADRAWIGRSNRNGSKLLPEGTYFYRISAGEKGTFGGFVVLRGTGN